MNSWYRTAQNLDKILTNWGSGKFDEQNFEELYQPYMQTAIERKFLTVKF